MRYVPNLSMKALVFLTINSPGTGVLETDPVWSGLGLVVGIGPFPQANREMASMHVSTSFEIFVDIIPPYFYGN
jgi:hypothetical protein